MKKWLLVWLVFLTSVAASASIRVFDQTGAALDHFSEQQCGDNQYCYRSGDKLVASPHYKYEISTSTTATSALCGVTFVVTADATVTLPEASTVDGRGCRYEFINGMSTWSSGTANLNLRIAPADSSDHIRVLATDAGDRLRNSTFGSSLILEAIGDDAWVPVVKEQGTWTDISH